MEIIGGEIVVANLFAFGQTKVELTQLGKINQAVEKRFGLIYLDITWNNLAGECDKHPKMFKIQGNAICRGTWGDPRTSICVAIRDTALPDEVKMRLVDLALAELPNLSQYFQEIFTPEYVADMFNCKIPENIREEFVALIREHVVSD